MEEAGRRVCKSTRAKLVAVSCIDLTFVSSVPSAFVSINATSRAPVSNTVAGMIVRANMEGLLVCMAGTEMARKHQQAVVSDT
jgi:hypothetical protein